MSISSEQAEITHAEAVALADRLAREGSPWNSPNTARRQRELGNEEIGRWLMGLEVAPYRAFAELVRIARPATLLEIGCGAGHYAKLLGHVLPGCAYTGVDNADEMIEEALRNVPGVGLTWGDPCWTGGLPYTDGAFELVVDGCAILHTLDWRGFLLGAARVTSRWVLLHRTPWSPDGRMHYYRKLAYDLPCMQIHFARDEVEALLKGQGFVLEAERLVSESSIYRITSTLWERREQPAL